jgi:hypothetical protein
MALYTITDLKNVLGQGAKVDRFTIDLSVPAGNAALTLGTTGGVLVKSSAFPDKQIGKCEVWEQGRKLIIPGNTEFTNEWSVTFYQTADHNLRKMFIKWMSEIDDYATNNHNCNPTQYMVDGKVQQLSCEGVVSAEYLFHNMYPSHIAEVVVDGQTINTIEEFQVTFTFSHWE